MLQRLLNDKEDTGQVFEIMRALNGTATATGYQRLLTTVQGGRIAYEREELAVRLMDDAWLDSFKDGSYDPSRIDALLKGRRLTKPLIAAVEGPAIAGGTEILQGTDIRIAGESATFGISEARWSLYPMGGSAVRLVRQIPYTIACDLLLTGRHITAAEALRYGLIGYVVPDGSALDKALEIAEVINNNGPLAVQAILKTIRETEGMHENDAFGPDTRNGIPVFLSEDSKEGPRAFAEKRAPRFQMK